MLETYTMKISLVDKDDKDKDEKARLFWLNKSPEERLSAVEFLREQYYIIQGYQLVLPMLRELRIVEILE